MRDFDSNSDSGGVQEATSPDESDPVSTRRYTVADGEPLDVAIVFAVAAMEGVDPTELERPLHDVVDADALRRLFASAGEALTATIAVDGHEVTVADGGRELIVSSI